MEFNQHISFYIEDRSYLSVIKNEIKRIAEGIELSTEEIGKLHIIVTELLTNLVKYGEKEREILIGPIIKNKYPGIEIISLDKGPGGENVNRMLEDGFSTSGTKGEGLGAVKRVSDEFDIYSQPGTGTLVLSRVFRKKANIYDKPKGRFEYGSIMVPKRGEHLCGDQWMLEQKEDETSLIMVDGLGHGPDAHAAAALAVETFKENLKFGHPEEILSHIHSSIKKTRGAVGLIIKINNGKRNIEYCGVGNISCRIINTVNFESNKSLILFNGILGLNVKRMNNSNAPWDSNKILVVHSDGLNTRWDLNNYPGILHHHPTLIAAALYRDHNRKNDDITIFVGRNRK